MVDDSLLDCTQAVCILMFLRKVDASCSVMQATLRQPFWLDLSNIYAVTWSRTFAGNPTIVHHLVPIG